MKDWSQGGGGGGYRKEHECEMTEGRSSEPMKSFVIHLEELKMESTSGGLINEILRSRLDGRTEEEEEEDCISVSTTGEQTRLIFYMEYAECVCVMISVSQEEKQTQGLFTCTRQAALS